MMISFNNKAIIIRNINKMYIIYLEIIFFPNESLNNYDAINTFISYIEF